MQNPTIYACNEYIIYFDRITGWLYVHNYFDLSQVGKFFVDIYSNLFAEKDFLVVGKGIIRTYNDIYQ